MSDNSSEATSANAMVTASGVNSLPSNPVSENNGSNTVTMIRTPAITGTATSRVAR